MNICGCEFTTPTKHLAAISPAMHGVYLIMVDGDVEYVGSTSRLYQRICEHRCKKFKGVDFRFCFMTCDNVLEVEQDIINRLSPPKNFMKSNAHEAKRISGSIYDMAKKVLSK